MGDPRPLGDEHAVTRKIMPTAAAARITRGRIWPGSHANRLALVKKR
jgi:hypothetical protein